MATSEVSTTELQRDLITMVEHTIDLAVQLERQAPPGTPMYADTRAAVSSLFQELEHLVGLQQVLKANAEAARAIVNVNDTATAEDVAALFNDTRKQALAASQRPIEENAKWREMKKKVTAVHHPEETMPWEDGEVFVVGTGTRTGTADEFRCPLTQSLLQTPLTCADCGHSFEKDAIVHYFTTRKPSRLRSQTAVPCPVSGCNTSIDPDRNLRENPELVVRLRFHQVELERAARARHRLSEEVGEVGLGTREPVGETRQGKRPRHSKSFVMKTEAPPQSQPNAATQADSASEAPAN